MLDDYLATFISNHEATLMHIGEQYKHTQQRSNMTELLSYYEYGECRVSVVCCAYDDLHGRKSMNYHLEFTDSATLLNSTKRVLIRCESPALLEEFQTFPRTKKFAELLLSTVDNVEWYHDDEIDTFFLKFQNQTSRDAVLFSIQ
jgi:hypothetical protein